jgi:hypothetical protein
MNAEAAAPRLPGLGYQVRSVSIYAVICAGCLGIDPSRPRASCSSCWGILVCPLGLVFRRRPQSESGANSRFCRLPRIALDR